MSRTHRSTRPRLEALREELREKERFMSDGYQSFQYLLEALKSSGHSQCTTVWTKDTVAYRCRTCQINDSSAICEICFHQGDHEFHDFVMYHSESGGCCDCGDREAWKEDGFCKIHQVSNQKPGHLPAKLYQLTKLTVCWALEKLSISVHIIWERRLKDRKADVQNEMHVASLYMEWVKKVCSVDVLRNLLSVLVTRKFLDGSRFEKNARGRKAAPLEILLKTLGSMPEELTEGATTLFLQMLYNGWFKSQFTEELMKHYPLMVDDVVGKVMKHSQHEGVITECKALDSTLDRVMVQLFNVAPTVMDLIKNNDLLWKFTSVFDGVLKMSLNQRGTVSVEHEAIRHKVYLRPQGDLRLIVSHSPVAVYVLNERLDVFEEILKVVTYLQWMNPYTWNRPVDFENDNAWTLAIQLEMNTMAIVFQLIARCYSSAECRETVKQALVEAGNRTLKSLHSYLSEETRKLTVKSMSLHIPLHRVLSAILSKLILLSWCDDKEGFLSSLKIDYTEEEVLSLLELPLRIAAWMVQIRANRWQHVSEEFYRLELIYRGSFWHDQSWDMDLLLLQFCAVAKEKMEHAIILRMAKCFELDDLVTSPSTGEKMFRFSPSYIQDFLRIILLVVRDRRNTGMKEEESLQYDVIQWLCVRDQTYSQLCRALSAIPVDHKKLSDILYKVADFRQPKVQERGYFQLKPEWWTKFDPLFAQFYPNELEDAQERAGHVGKQQFYWRIGLPHEAPPPYNRLTNLLHTQECHQLLWNVLNHVKILVKTNETSTAGEALGVTALQMMEIALRDRLQYQPSSGAPQSSGLHLNDILVNIKLTLPTYPGMVVGGSSTWKLGSSSMYDLLQEFQSLTNAHRLADYAQYTLHLLHSSFPMYFGAEFRGSKLKKSPEYQASIVEDERQRLKKERQAALLAKFSAQQKAFLEQHGDHEEEDDEHGYDDAGPTEGSHVGSEAGGNFERISGKAPAVVTLTETTFGIQECAFCRRKCDSSDSPAGWIAFMQCYNMPRQVLKKERAERVKILEEAESIAKGDDSKQLVTLIEPQNLDSGVCNFRGGSLDYYPTEHVACCGHQMHQACFESYVSNLGHQHHQGNRYEGDYIIDVVNRGEIWCPICRRLANVLLPVVEESCLQRMLDGQAEGSADENLSWRRFGDPWKKIVKAIDSFASQTVRVREKFCVMLEAKDVPSCQLLWEVFAGNIVHFEVETREKINDSGSSSSAPIPLRDAWGGEAGHLTALRELGKLAMLSNTIKAGIVSEKKKEQLKRLWHDLALLCRNEKKMDPPGSFDLNSAPVWQHLTEIVEKLFPTDGSHSKREVDMKNREMSEDEISLQASGWDCLRKDFITSPPLEEKQEEILLPKSSTPHFQGGPGMKHLEQPGLPVESSHKGLSKYVPPQPSSGETQPPTIPEIHEYEYMHPKFMEGHLLKVDPFAILTCLLLSCFEGCLKLRQIIWMVEFAYIVAIIQTSIALTRLEAHLEAVNIKLVIQNACLPFLRRAALLVQLVPCEELDMKHYGSGSKLMDAAYLEQYLEQQEVWGSIAIDQAGENKQITVLEYLQQRFSTSELLNSPSWGIPSLCECSDFDCLAADWVQLDRSKQGLRALPFLCKVSKQLCLTPLPSVYQDLLWRSIREKCKVCDKVPIDAAFCLICGDLLCFESKCSDHAAEHGGSTHAEQEYAGIGIFLLMRTTQVLLMRGNRVCILPSIYLDQHGEVSFFTNSLLP
ncbi:unnamed protein product [Sphagnum jensenii]|uniref:E3 ubiquitin-protein ligase n=1 Tax=Sphagnum jensenii TaxID=128206 RepID=A0ABP0ZWW6_9BRYO